MKRKIKFLEIVTGVIILISSILLFFNDCSKIDMIMLFLAIVVISINIKLLNEEMKIHYKLSFFRDMKIIGVIYELCDKLKIDYDRLIIDQELKGKNIMSNNINITYDLENGLIINFTKDDLSQIVSKKPNIELTNGGKLEFRYDAAGNYSSCIFKKDEESREIDVNKMLNYIYTTIKNDYKL